MKDVSVGCFTYDEIGTFLRGTLWLLEACGAYEFWFDKKCSFTSFHLTPRQENILIKQWELVRGTMPYIHLYIAPCCPTDFLFDSQVKPLSQVLVLW